MASEVRLIDANALRKKALWMEMPDNQGINFNVHAVPVLSIDDAPTIDPESLRPKGRWIKTKETLGYQDVDCVECSVCHDSWLADEDNSFEYLGHWHYCPNCGAKTEG